MDLSERYQNNEYRDSNPTWHAEDSPWKAQQIATMLNKHAFSPSTICEIGCGAGDILLRLSESFPNSTLHGYEVSKDAFDICEPKQTEQVKFYLEDVVATEATYELLLCIDVFEHIADYIGFLNNIKQKASNHIFHIPLDISVKSIFCNSMMKGRVSAGHLHYFTPETAIATLQDAGYRIRDYVYTAPFLKGGIPSKTFNAKALTLPRRILFGLSPSFLSKTLGGCSLLVFAQPDVADSHL